MVRERIRFAVTCTRWAVGETKGLWSRTNHFVCAARRLIQINARTLTRCDGGNVRSGATQPQRRHRRGLICPSGSSGRGWRICPGPTFFGGLDPNRPLPDAPCVIPSTCWWTASRGEGLCSRAGSRHTRLVRAHKAAAATSAARIAARQRAAIIVRATRPCAGHRKWAQAGPDTSGCRLSPSNWCGHERR